MAKLAGSSEKLCQDLLQDSKFSLGQVVVLVPLCIRAKEKPRASSPHRELALKPILWCTDACIVFVCLTGAGWELTWAPGALPEGIRRYFSPIFSNFDGGGPGNTASIY